jgi:hypothetical protein
MSDAGLGQAIRLIISDPYEALLKTRALGLEGARDVLLDQPRAVSSRKAARMTSSTLCPARCLSWATPPVGSRLGYARSRSRRGSATQCSEVGSQFARRRRRRCAPGRRAAPSTRPEGDRDLLPYRGSAIRTLSSRTACGEGAAGGRGRGLGQGACPPARSTTWSRPWQANALLTSSERANEPNLQPLR